MMSAMLGIHTRFSSVMLRSGSAAAGSVGWLAFFAAFVALGASGCAEDVDSQPPGPATIEAIFNPAAGALPTPTDLVRNQQTGLLAVPVADAERAPAQAEFDAYLNTLDGFPVSSTVSLCFSAPIDPESLTAGLKVLALPSAGDSEAPPSAPTDISATVSVVSTSETLRCPVLGLVECDPTAETTGCADGERCVPTAAEVPRLGLCAQPGQQIVLSRNSGWDRASTYAFYLTRAVKGAQGEPVVRSATFDLVTGSEPLCLFDEASAKCTVNYSSIVTSQVERTLRPLAKFISVSEFEATVASAEIDAVTQLEGLRRAMNSLLSVSGLERDEIVMAWSFTTLSMVEALFDPTAGVLPGPGNDMPGLYDAEARRVSIPARPGESAAAAALRGGLNTLDGSSTTATYFALFSGELADKDIASGSDFLLINLDDPSDKPQVAFAYDSSARAVTITPVQPLAEGKRYAVVMVSKQMNADGSKSASATAPIGRLSGGGLSAADGSRVAASPVFALVRAKAPLIDEAGNPIVSGLDRESAAALEGIRLHNDAVLKTIEADSSLGIDRKNVVVFWTFVTQTFSEDLAKIRSLPYSPVTLAAADANTPKFGGTHARTLRICSQSVAQPCWPAEIPRDAVGAWTVNGSFRSWNALDPVSGNFLADLTSGKATTPVPQTGSPGSPSDKDIPFILITPKAAPPLPGGACPAGFSRENEGQNPPDPCIPAVDGPGWPLVIYQHGITRQKSDVLAIANTLAAAGFATLAFDIPFHGARSVCTKQDDCVQTETLQTSCDPTSRRCCRTGTNDDCQPSYFVDLDENGVPDVSGGPAFLNGANPFAIRDNMRQYVIDASALVRALHLGAEDGLLVISGSDEGAEPLAGEKVRLDGSRIDFAGHSLGAMLGVLFLASDPLVSGEDPPRALLSTPGAPLIETFATSPNPEFKAIIEGLMRAQGIEAGTAQALSFLHLLQWILDPADPANFARYLKDGGLQDLVASQVKGEDIRVSKKEIMMQIATEDQVIATARQAALAELIGVDVGKSSYQAGHSFLLRPSVDNPALTVSAQAQMATFLISGQVCTPDTSAGTCTP